MRWSIQPVVANVHQWREKERGRPALNSLWVKPTVSFIAVISRKTKKKKLPKKIICTCYFGGLAATTFAYSSVFILLWSHMITQCTHGSLIPAPREGEKERERERERERNLWKVDGRKELHHKEHDSFEQEVGILHSAIQSEKFRFATSEN